MGEDTYVVEMPKLRFCTPQLEIFSFLRDKIFLHSDGLFQMEICGSGRIQLSGSGYRPHENLFFVKEESPSPFYVSTCPAPADDFAQSVEDKAQWMVSALSFIDKHYKETGFGPFWGSNNVFDILKDYTHSFCMFKTSSEETKKNLTDFFVQKYLDFRKINTSPYGDGYYANEYLGRLQSVIPKDLEIEVVFPAKSA